MGLLTLVGQPVRLQAQPAAVIYQDARGDAVLRPTDPGLSLPFQAENSLIDLLRIEIGPWMPDDPALNPFEGDFQPAGLFLRMNVVVRGLVNPPGELSSLFQPLRYGPRPIYGFIEIDMDADVDTGGEFAAPSFRYLANVVRFGGLSTDPDIADRMALSSADVDTSFSSPPWIERHGEEFHLALMEGQFTDQDIEVLAGDGDLLFEIGESWRIEGSFFHRAHGFEPFSFVKGGAHAGEYAPDCDLMFRHDPTEDATTIALVFPLTNAGSAQRRAEPVQPYNENPSDQASILEALYDLQLSASFVESFPTGMPQQVLISEWADRNPEDYLDPSAWRVTALLGSSYDVPSPGYTYFIWTDIYPNVVPGDVDGSGNSDGRDVQLIAQYIAMNDRHDGSVDGIVDIQDFAQEFHLFDVNYDGRVDAMDLVESTRDGDGDLDGDVDLADFAILQCCFGLPGGLNAPCGHMDFTGDGQVTLDDFEPFHGMISGPLQAGP